MNSEKYIATSEPLPVSTTDPLITEKREMTCFVSSGQPTLNRPDVHLSAIVLDAATITVCSAIVLLSIAAVRVQSQVTIVAFHLLPRCRPCFDVTRTATQPGSTAQGHVLTRNMFVV